jgi:hypothetical protein
MVQSTLLIALKSDVIPSWESEDAELTAYLQHEVTELISSDLPLLTDEFAPVDYYTNKAIR